MAMGRRPAQGRARRSRPVRLQVAAGRVGGLTAWARDRERMLRIAARGNDRLMRRLGNKSAVKLHFMRLARKRWEKQKSATP